MAAGDRRTIPLDAARADGWFEKLAESGSSFDQLCDILGDRFVAFTVIAGVQVTSVMVDQARPSNSLVDFTVGDSERQHRLPLDEFRRRVAAAVLADEAHAPSLSEDPGAEELQEYIGVVPVLLAPLFGMALVSLHVGGDAPPSLVLEAGAVRDEMPLTRFRALIRERIEAELQRVQSRAPFSVDLQIVERAEQANEAGDWEETIDLLGGWPGPLSMLMRTAEGQQLTAEVRATLARGLGLLGTAYVETGHSEWAEEIMRLGIQWSQDGPVAGDLFRRLGEAYVAQDRQGEAIAFFRRALALGAPRGDVLPVLARCYAGRGRYVAAAACVDEARAVGVPEGDLRELRDGIRDHLGEAWDRFREHVPLDDEAVTTPPPGDER